MFGYCKVHKECFDGFPPFRSILSALQTPTYKLAKYLVLILKLLTKNKYTVKDLFNFATEIVEQDSGNFMGSLDIDLLFTNIPLEETIQICTNNLFKNSDIFHGFKKSEFKDLLSLATKESYYTFNNILLANLFLAHHEQNWLQIVVLWNADHLIIDGMFL